MTSRGSNARVFAAGVLSAGVVTTVWTATRHRGGSGRWQRRNFRDREVSLLLGPAVGAGALAGVAAAGGRGRGSALLVVASAAAVGAYDDLYGDRHARGLGGHARALLEGRVTTGMVKLVGLIAAAALATGWRHRDPVDAALGTVLVAGGANLVNLFDLRPGRAAKVTALGAAALSIGASDEGRAIAAVAAGTAGAAMRPDLAERAMLGDCGAGTLGVLLGWSAAVTGSRQRRLALAAAVVGLTAASERVSFSSVIDASPALRAVDALGRATA